MGRRFAAVFPTPSVMGLCIVPTLESRFDALAATRIRAKYGNMFCDTFIETKHCHFVYLDGFLEKNSTKQISRYNIVH